ncbi:MAG: matrixin family metalloprotease [archaeon]|nr:matrixin family metalloprotease [archaeon]
MNKYVIVALLVLIISGLVLALPPQAKEKDKGPLEKITFIHYKKSNAKPPWAGGGNDSAATCYGFLAKGAKWKATENFLINPTNSQGISSSLIVNSTNAGIEAWDSESLFNIFGNPSIDSLASYNNGSLDEKNTLSFGTISDSGAIAVTNVWGYFSGPPKTRELVEWDMLLDQTDFQWGNADADPAKMDLQNIITHELGHSAGLGDLYTSGCAEETMYGYSTEGETKKRTLESGDIAGLAELYN